MLKVIKIPITDCSFHQNCTSCLESGNPLCGWCLLENKCSRNVECQSFSTRWIQANKTNTLECLTVTVTPLEYVTDNPQPVCYRSRVILFVIAMSQQLWWHHADYLTSIKESSYLTRKWILPLPPSQQHWKCAHCGSYRFSNYLHLQHYWENFKLPAINYRYTILYAFLCSLLYWDLY